MKFGLLLWLPLLGGARPGRPPAVRVTFSPLTKVAKLAAQKRVVVTKPLVTFPLKKQRGRLVIPTPKGPRVFRDARVEEDNPGWEKFDYKGYLPQVECHLVFHRHYEWSRLIVVSASGQQLILQERPEFSLDLRSFVAISAGLEYWANDNYIRLFRFENQAWREVWHMEPKNWEPSRISWLSNKTLLLTKQHWSEDAGRSWDSYARLTVN